MTIRRARIAATLLLALVMAATALAQSTASISGVVVDAAGAVIPGADVVVKNVATSETFSTVTSGQGVFSVPALNTGTYSVSVSLTGFKTAVFRGLASGVGPPSANFGPTVNAALRTTLLTLTDANRLPLVWADTSGAARTGWAAAVVEMALGVTEEEVMEDYLLTNQFRGPSTNAQLNALLRSGRLGKSVYLEPQLFERAEYLQAALDEMRQLYGTFDNYVHQALGITDEQLEQIRENLLKD